MTGETDNLPLGGTDNATPPTALDHPDNLNFLEPDDELDNHEAQQHGTDDEREPVEINDGQETDQPEFLDDTDPALEAEQPEGSEAAIKDDVVVTVNGEQVALGDLKAGYMKQADYSRKTQELSNKRRDLEVLSTRVQHSVNAIAQFLTNQIPPMPDASLAMTDPSRYVREKAVHENAMSQVTQVLQQSGDVVGVANTLTAEQRSEVLATENAKLAEAFPQTATQEGRQKFFERAAGAAQHFGYTQAEIGEVTDHRMFALAHYAKIGIEAEAARKKAREKVADVPPVAPQRRQQGQNAGKVQANRDAIKRLNETGSIHDAMRIDFD